MLLLAKHMYGALVEASDGKVGKLCDLLFDDDKWAVRSLVLDSGSWLYSRRVTLPPDIVRHKDWDDHRLLIADLTRQQVMECHDTETHIPVGDQTKLEEAVIVDWGVYWVDVMRHPWQVSSDPHLRNTQEVTGYHIEGSDGPMGHIADFVIDDQTWTVRYLAVDTRNWWPGKHVLVVPTRVESIGGQDRTVILGLSREAIQQSPEYEATMPVEEPHEMPIGGQ